MQSFSQTRSRACLLCFGKCKTHIVGAFEAVDGTVCNYISIKQQQGGVKSVIARCGRRGVVADSQ